MTSIQHATKATTPTTFTDVAKGAAFIFCNGLNISYIGFKYQGMLSLGGVYLESMSYATNIFLSTPSFIVSCYLLISMMYQQQINPNIENKLVKKAMGISNSFYMCFPLLFLGVYFFFTYGSFNGVTFKGHPSYAEKAEFLIFYSGVMVYWTDILTAFINHFIYKFPDEIIDSDDKDQSLLCRK